MYFQLFFIEIIFDLVCALYYELTVFVWIMNGFIFWNSSEFFFFFLHVWYGPILGLQLHLNEVWQ